MEQIRAFEEAGRANRTAEVIDHSIAVRAAGADGKVWKKYIDSLKNVVEPEKKAEVKVITREGAAMLRNLLAGRKPRVN
jgi:hypothetical protein